MPDIATIIKTVGLVGVLLIVFAESGLFFGFLLPGDSLLFVSGLLASAGYFNFWILLFGVMVCAILGDSVGYYLGRKVGHKIFFRDDSFFFNKKYIDKTKAFYEKHGTKTILLARLVPIVRTFAPILAGVGEMNYRTFIKYNVIGGILWPLIMIPAGYFLGNVITDIDKYILPITGLIILVSFFPIFSEMLKKKSS